MPAPAVESPEVDDAPAAAPPAEGELAVAPEGHAPPGPVDDGAETDSEAEESLDKHQRLLKEANSLEHRMSHFPKNPACEICQHSCMYRKKTSKKREDPLMDRGSPPETSAFGERVATDFVVVQRLSERMLSR